MHLLYHGLKRLRRGSKLDVYPKLRTVGLDIEILLVIKSQKSFAKLHVESYLGYDKIRGGSENYRRIKIFSGHLQETGVV